MPCTSVILRIIHFARGDGVAAAAVLLAFLATTPELSSTLYWLSAASCYTLGVGFFLRLLCRLRDPAPGARPLVHFGATALLLVAVIGCNEALMLLSVACVGLRLGWAVVRRERELPAWVAMLVLALGLGAVVFLAPGNEIRGVSFPLRKQLGFSILHSLDRIYPLYKSWLSSPVALGTLALAACFGRRRRAHEALAGVAAGVLATGLVVFAALWSMGQYPEDRTMEAPYLFFLLSMAGVALGRYPRRLARWRPWARVAAGGAFAVSAATSGHLGTVLAELRGPAPAHRAHHAEVMARLAACRESGAQLCEVPAHPEPVPTSLVYSTLTADPGHWRNSCAAEAVGVRAIRAGGDTGAIPFVRPPEVLALEGKPLVDLERSGARFRAYWGLGRHSGTHVPVAEGEDARAVEAALPEGVLRIEKDGAPFLALFRRNPWTGRVSTVAVASLGPRKPGTLLLAPQRCKGLRMTLAVALALEADAASGRPVSVWYLDQGEQRIFREEAYDGPVCRPET